MINSPHIGVSTNELYTPLVFHSIRVSRCQHNEGLPTRVDVFDGIVVHGGCDLNLHAVKTEVESSRYIVVHEEILLAGFTRSCHIILEYLWRSAIYLVLRYTFIELSVGFIVVLLEGSFQQLF